MKEAGHISLAAALCGLMAIFLVYVPCFAAPSLAISSPDEWKDWELVQNCGSATFDKNQYGIAERLLREAVAKARLLGSDDIRLAKSPGDLGRLLTVRARFKEAEPYLEEELRIKQRVMGFDSGKIIPPMGTMIAFYLDYGTVHSADKLTEDLLFLVEGKMRDEIAKAQGKVKVQKGAPLQGWAGIAEPGLHEKLIEWAITCDQIGGMYAARGNYDTADRLFKAALDAKASVLGKQHLSLANSYDSLGAICMARNEMRDAESYLRESLEITDKILSPESPQSYARLDKLARCLIKEKKYDEAEKLYLHANQVFRTAPSKCGDEARCVFALGCLYSDERRYAEAAGMLRRALLLSEIYNGNWSISLVPYLRKLAYVEYYLGQRGIEGQLKARANSIAPEVKALKSTAEMKAGDWTKKSTTASDKPAHSAKHRSKPKAVRRKHSKHRA